MKADRYNVGKPQLSHVLEFSNALEELATLCEVGAMKYARGNWKLGGKPQTEYLDSAMRHLVALANGQEYYTERNVDDTIIAIPVNHAAAVMWNMAVFIEMSKKEDEKEDEKEESMRAKYLESIGLTLEEEEEEEFRVQTRKGVTD